MLYCKNCNSTLNSTDNYCNSCGAKVIRNRLTIKNLLAHVIEQFFSYDNKFLKTFISLFRKPEDVIGSYINGTRKKYINAIQYFAIAITLSGLQMFIINKFFPDAFDMSSYYEGQKPTPGFDQLEFNNKVAGITQEYQSLIMMFYVPFYALLSKIVFFNYKQYNYTEHLVIFLYAQAQSSIFGFFFLSTLLWLKVPMVVSSLVYLLLMFLYVTYVLKRMHNLSFLETILKILIFGVIFIVLFVIPIMAYGVYVALQAAGKG